VCGGWPGWLSFAAVFATAAAVVASGPVFVAAVGDVLATPVTGAYGHSMGSNYNKVLRPAVVFCRDGDARLVIRRETYDDLLTTDLG